MDTKATKGPQSKPLSAKQQDFAREYAIDLNGSRAAIRAGYSPKRSKHQAYEMLRDPRIMDLVDAARAERAKRVSVDQDVVILALRDTLDNCLAGTPILDAKGNDTGRSKIDAAGANRSAELLGKHLGMFREQIDHTIGLRLTHEEALAQLDD